MSNLSQIRGDGRFVFQKSLIIPEQPNLNKDFQENEQGSIDIDDESGFRETTVEDLKQSEPDKYQELAKQLNIFQEINLDQNPMDVGDVIGLLGKAFPCLLPDGVGDPTDNENRMDRLKFAE